MRTRLSLVACLLMLALATPAVAQGEITFETTELRPGLYMLEGKGGFSGGNLGLLTGEDGVVLIDDGLPPLTATLLAAIGKVTKDPIEFVINTHVHGDHIGGNEALAKVGATIVAHDRLRARLVADGVTTATGQAPAPKGALPVLTFSDAVTIHLNGHEAFVFHVAAAHTDGDAVIHFPGANVLHAGDVMFNRIFPFIDLDSGGSVEGYIAAQKKILSMINDETKIIPGHGPLANAKDLKASIAMLEASLGTIRGLMAQGMSEEEIVAANPLKAYESWNWGFITTERMARTIIRDLTAN